MDSPPAVYSTTQGGVDVAQAISTSLAGLGFETSTGRPPEDLAVEFCDYPFTQRTFMFRQHLEVVEREQPAVAVAPDIEERRDPDEVYDQADLLADHADAVVVVPKSVHPSDVPDRFRVGVPLASFGSDAPWELTDYQDCREVHLLGGSPAVQLATRDYDLPVASVDTSVPTMVAQEGFNVWTPDGWVSTPTGLDISVYELIRHSYDNYVKTWAEPTGRFDPIWLPEDATDRQEIRMNLAGRGPPMVGKSDLDALGPEEREEFESVPDGALADALNEADSEVVRSFPALPDDQVTFDAYSNTDLARAVATDGGQSEDDADDAPTPRHFGDYRRDSLARLENTPHLDPIETFGSVDEMVAAIEAIHIPDYSKPPEKIISKLRANFQKLPDAESERYYLDDYKLVRTINAARRAFNEWVGKKKRYDQMPGWAEAGPANYPRKKHARLRDSEHKGRETLDEKLDRLNGRTKGAFRRALKKAGYSEAELNEQKREDQREKGREQYEKGDIVAFFSTKSDWLPWVVKRVNKKSLTLGRPHPYAGQPVAMGDGTYPEYDTANAKLDSPQWLNGPLTEEQVAEIDDLPDTLREAQISLVGEAWVDRHVPDPAESNDGNDMTDTNDDTDTYDPSTEWSTGQQGLGGGPAAGQAEFDAPAPQGKTEIESIDAVNEGGLMADTRIDLPNLSEAEQETLEVGADLQGDPDQDGLDTFGSDDPYDPTWEFTDYGPTSDEPIPGGAYPHPAERLGDDPDLAEIGTREDQANAERFERRLDKREDAATIATDLAAQTSDDPADEDMTTPTEDRDEDTGYGEHIEFNSRDEANEWRDDNPDALHPSEDDRRRKTVVLHPDVDRDDRVNAEETAFLSMQGKIKRYGQTPLSTSEKKTLKARDDWEWTKNAFEAQAAKAALQAEGASDWLNYYEAGMLPGDALATMDQGKRMQVLTGAPTAIEDTIDDRDEDVSEKAAKAAKFQGIQCQKARDYCESGDGDACSFLQDECDWTPAQVEELRAAMEAVGEEFSVEGTVYDPTAETDGDGQTYDEWAAANEPGDDFAAWAATTEPAAEVPPDEELARLAPTVTDDPEELQALPGPAYRALRKAWSGYKLARLEHREANRRAEQYASVINGIRTVNGQNPLSFDELDGWAGGEVISDDPTETYPTEGGQMSLAEAAREGRVTGHVQSTLSGIADQMDDDPYDPTGEFA